MKCQICGNYSNTYSLCRECFNELEEEGKITQCDFCKAWVIEGEEHNCYTKAVYESKIKMCEKCYNYIPENTEHKCEKYSALIRFKQLKNLSQKKEIFFYPACKICGKENKELGIKIEEGIKSGYWVCEDCLDKYKENNNKITCIICGEDSKGQHFCENCNKKYRRREMDLHLKNCAEFKITDEYGNKTYECDSQITVRSRAEKMIADFLFHNKVRYVYEKIIYYKENGEDKKLKPDFYLPDYGIYIEYNEYKDKFYLEGKEYSYEIYKKLKLKIEVMTEVELKSIASFLKPLLDLH